MTKEQFDACLEHSYKDCNKCLLIECQHNLSDDDGFEGVEE